MDGHHKLIRCVCTIYYNSYIYLCRWKIVVHGCIDGYSRRIIYLKACDNNRSDTVLQLFIEAVDKFGLPSCVRADMRGENVIVAQFMLQHPQKGPGRGSFITGRSVHIERLWRDVFKAAWYYFIVCFIKWKTRQYLMWTMICIYFAFIMYSFPE